jgi:ribonuclease BN (tRNA processing enzyme)
VTGEQTRGMDMTHIELTVLGCATPHPLPDRPCSGYLVRGGGATVWLDTGGGTCAELQRHTSLDDVDLIWVSHLHPDHSTDLLAAWNHYVNADNPPRPVVAGPPGWAGQADAFLGRPGAMAEVFDIVELGDGQVVKAGGLTLTAFRMRHGVPTFGVRIEDADGNVLAYSADTAPCDALGVLAADADVLVAEVGADEPHPGHCTPEDVAAAAIASRARWVLLTHLAPGLTPDAAEERARRAGLRHFGIAAPGLHIQTPSPA